MRLHHDICDYASMIYRASLAHTSNEHSRSSVWILGPSLTYRMGVAGMAGPVDHALAAVSGKKLIMDAPKVSTCTNRTFSAQDLPFKPIPEGDPSTSHITNSLEILRGLGSKPDTQGNGEMIEEGTHCGDCSSCYWDATASS